LAKLDPVIGRDAEIPPRQPGTDPALSKDNPVLKFGEPGVGKTAFVVEGENRPTHHLVAGDVADSLKVKQLVSLDLETWSPVQYRGVSSGG